MKENQGFATGRLGRRYETQKQQREASPKLHPRGLARSIGKAMGAGKEWRKAVAALPAEGQRYLHPERRRKETRV